MYNLQPLKNKIKETENWLDKELSSIRTGRANPTLLDNVRVESYGAMVPISQIAGVTIEGSRTLRITPWDATHSKSIDKAITAANLGMSISIDEKGLRVNFPELTSESRAQIVKAAKEKMEEAKKQVRSHRDEVIKDIKGKEKTGGFGKDDIFRYEKDTQKLVDDTNKKLEAAFAKKEKEILS